tara:strand:- start:4534 stop:6792 length:2259 start_codon:yes stop_codon:yes gene_type:complete
MAKKPRTQVDYNPGQASLQGGVGASEGNYRVAVAPTPKTNAALQFASFINQIPNVAGQYTNYIEAIGQEKLAMMTEDELIEELAGGDKDTLNILKYNKAYNYGLVEKNFKRNVEAYQKQFDDIAGQIETYPDNDSFIAALDNLDASIGSEFIGQTANDYQKKAGEALLFNTLPTLRAKSLQKYQAFKQDATIQLITGSLHDDMIADTQMNAAEKSNLFLRQFQTELRQFSNLTPSDKSRLYEQFVLNGVARYQARGQENEAVDFLEAAGLFEIYPGARLGSIGDNPAQFERLRQSLIEVDTEKGETLAANRSRVNNSAKTAYRALHIGEVGKEGISVDLDDLVDAVSTHESAEWKRTAMAALMEQIDLKSPSVIERSSSLARGLRLLKGATQNERTRDLLNEAVGEVEPAQDLYLRKTNLEPEDTNELDTVVSDFVTQDWAAPIPDIFRIPRTGKQVSSGSAAGIASLKEARKSLPFLQADTPTEPLMNYLQTLSKLATKGDFEDQSPVIQGGLFTYLKDTNINNELWNESQGNVAKYKALLSDTANKWITDQKQKYDLDNELRELQVKQERDVGVWDVTGSEFQEFEDEVREAATKGGILQTGLRKLLGGDAVEGLKSLQDNFEFNAEDISKDRQTLDKIINDQKGKDRDIAYKALSYSFQKYGFNRLEDIDSDLIRKLKLQDPQKEKYPVIYITKVPIGDDFKQQLGLALGYLNGLKTKNAENAYDLVKDKLKSDEVNEIEWWRNALKNN